MTVEHEIRNLASAYSDRLKKVIDKRVEEMKFDDFSHYLIYQVLGISNQESHLIGVYQNKARRLG